MKRAAAAFLLVLSLTPERGARASAPDQITAPTARAVGSWAAAVRSHTPGRRDAATGQIAALTFAGRSELNPGITLFLAKLQGKRVTTANDAEKWIVELAKGVTLSPGADVSHVISYLRRTQSWHGPSTLLSTFTLPGCYPLQIHPEEFRTSCEDSLRARGVFLFGRHGLWEYRDLHELRWSVVDDVLHYL